MTSRPHIYIATPCYGGLVSNQYLTGIVGLVQLLDKSNVDYTLATMGNESLITRARNHLVWRMLQTKATHLLFIDADIGFDPELVMHMLSTNRDVVAAPYPKKSIDWAGAARAAKEGRDVESAAVQFAINFSADDQARGEVTMRDGCIKVHDAATGFMMIRREVLERLRDAHPETMYRSGHEENSGQDEHALFDCFIDSDRSYLSEDYAFCRRWQAIGGEVWLYMPTQLMHCGTYAFKGDPMAMLGAGS